MKSYNSGFWLMLRIFVLLQFFATVPGEVYYALEFTDSIMSCPDFDNKHIKADTMKMGLVPGEDGEPDTFGLNGDIEVIAPIDSDYNMEFEVCKETEVTCEPMFTAGCSIGDSLKDEDAPWFPMYQMMNITECPIAEGSYPIKNLKLSIEQFKGCLSRDFCGYYAIKLSILENLDVVSCHMAYIEIVEKETE